MTSLRMCDPRSIGTCRRLPLLQYYDDLVLLIIKLPAFYQSQIVNFLIYTLVRVTI